MLEEAGVDLAEASVHFRGSIKEKVSGLEGCHVAFEARLRRDWKFVVGDLDCRFRWPYRREAIRSRRLPRGV